VRRTTRDTIRISKISGSEAHLSTQAVAQSLIYYVDALQGVVRVRPRLAADANAISVRVMYAVRYYPLDWTTLDALTATAANRPATALALKAGATYSLNFKVSN